MNAVRPVVIFGIDPSASSSGWCIDLGDSVAFGTCQIDEIGSLPWSQWDAARVVVCIECPVNMYRGSNHVVRSASRLWMSRIKKQFPRRVTVVGSKTGFVDPSVWRDAIFGKQGKDADWKELALMYCRTQHPAVTDHNQAEAFCIMRYAKSMYRLRLALDNANKKTKGKHEPRSKK
jgi:hypothetical protein